MNYVSLLLVLAVISATACGTTTTTIDFSPQSLKSVTVSGKEVVNKTTGKVEIDTFKVGDVLIEETTKVKMVVLPFKRPSPTTQHPGCPPGITGWTPKGRILIVQENMSGGTGNELRFNNANFGVIAPTGATVKNVSFKFGDHGGNINLILRDKTGQGALHDSLSFGDIPPPAGVNLAVSPTLPFGTLELSGDLSPFYYTFPCPAFFPVQQYIAVVGGGQELWIDDLEFTLSQ